MVARLPDGDRPAKVIDRRLDPRAGYRAVHIEVRREGILLELDETAAMIDEVEADLTSTDPTVRNLATSAQKRLVDTLDTANHYLEQLP